MTRLAPLEPPLASDVSLLPSPGDLGMPAKFDAWRPGQDRAILLALDSTKPVVARADPVGAGKSLTYMTVAKLTGRTVVLVSTKALQDQIAADFSSLGIVDVRGMNAYPCRALTEPDAGHLLDASAFRLKRADANPSDARVSCDHGPCHLGMRCALKQGGCDYYDRVREAESADLVVTNYAFWLATNAFRRRKASYEEIEEGGSTTVQGIGKFDLLVCDEAHDAPKQLEGFLTVVLSQYEAESVLGTTLLSPEHDAEAWRQWARFHQTRAERRLEQLQEATRANVSEDGSSSHGPDRGTLKQIKDLKEVLRKLGMLADRPVPWAIERVAPPEDGEVRPGLPDVQFAPIDVAPLASEYLFRNTPKVLLVSATLTGKTLDYLGLARTDVDLFESPSSFPIERRPIYHYNPLPSVRLKGEPSEDVKRLWVGRIDQIIRSRPGVRGIIHTKSYARARAISELSRFRHLLIWHGSGRYAKRTLAQAIAQFLETPAEESPWLISPSLTTGYDFAYDKARVQIVAKVPFPDARSALMKARTERDKDYPYYLALQELQQTVGRVMRAPDDRGETWIVDDQIDWLIWKHGAMTTAWFREAVITTGMLVPMPDWSAA